MLRAVRRRRTGSSTRPARPTSPAPSSRDAARPRPLSGLEVATHAIGDAAVAAALDAYADTGARSARSSTPSWSAATTYAGWPSSACGPACSRRHLLDDRDLTELIWPGRGERCFAFRWMLDDGVRARASARTPRSRRSTRGWRWRPRCTAAPTTAPAWHPEQALTAARGAGRLGRRPADGRRRLARATWCCSTATRWRPHADAGGRRQGAPRDLRSALTVVAGRVVHARSRRAAAPSRGSARRRPPARAGRGAAPSRGGGRRGSPRSRAPRSRCRGSCWRRRG